MHDRETPSARSRTLFAGLLGWLLFSVAAVLVRGVRWEETYEHALIITRMAPYPEGHPAFIYWRNVFSGQSYLSALLIWCNDSPVLLNGLRNVLQLAFCTVPVYLLGARFGGRAIHGHIAAAFVLVGIHRSFQSYYPIESWPHFYSVGQIGAGYTLLVLACFLHGWWRTAWFLMALMPAVHIGQVPGIGAIAGMMGLLAIYRRDQKNVRAGFQYLGLGLISCLVFFLIQHQFSVRMPEEGAYAATGDVQAIWAEYSSRYDLHRFVPRLNPGWKSWLGAALAVLVMAGGMGGARQDTDRQRAYTWAALFAGVTVLATGTIALVHGALGTNMPFLLIGWMPYRLLNHLAVLLVPSVIGVLLCRGQSAGKALIVLAMLYAALYPVWGALLPPTLYTRYAGNPEGILFGLCGAALSAIAVASWGNSRGLKVWLAGCVTLGVLLVALYPFGAAAAVVGALAWLVLHALPRLRNPAARSLFGPLGPNGPKTSAGAKETRSTSVFQFPLQAAVCVALLASLLWGQWRTREHLPQQPIHRDVEQYLAERGENDAMLVTPYWDVGWVGKTRHPIFADYQFAHLVTYMPPLGPYLKKMHAEVFGFEMGAESNAPLASWPDRTAAEWQQLAEAYGFRYVLAPSEMTLRIEPVLESFPYHLYRVVP